MNISTVGRSGAPSLSSSPRALAAVRLGGVAAVAAGALMVAHQVADSVIGGRTTDGPRALLHTAWLAALFLTVRGVRALQRPASDRVADVLLRIALTGLGAMAVLAAVEAVSLFAGADSSDDPPLPILVAMIGALALLVVGLLAFALAVLRAGVLPRPVGLLLLAGVLVKMFAPEPVPSLAIFGLAVAWLGVTMLRRMAAAASLFSVPRPPKGADAFPDLTSRQIEILALMARHEPNPDIARHLHITEKTVRNNVSAILTKLCVRDRAEAIAAAHAANLGTAGQYRS